MKYDNLEHNDMDHNAGQRMHNTFSRGNTNEISELISSFAMGYYLNSLYEGYTPLMYASKLNCVKAVALLLNKPEVKQEIDYTNRDRSALTIAAQCGCFDIAKLLIANDATVTADIKEAARKGNNQYIIALLANPAAMENLRANPPTLMAAPAPYSATRESDRCAIL